ncbi:septation protein SepH [Nocardiopsis sp. NPDC057823]|uniref:septation protein SepH n=1 Tax=Nocardiopsis sp. NPDC057823 TaxID=3346256 RepID=UPI00366E1F2B
MHELRLVAVSEDGTYLVLASTGRGTRFMLPVDDRLRAAVRGQFSRLGQYEIEVENPLRPKEIQARIRSGETAEAISEISGIPIERVRWFEGPVLQEREYIAQQAQRAAVRIAGEAAPAGNLEELVTRRIGAHQLETGDAVWDSWKREDRTWQLKLVFLDGGEERVAHWLYEPRHNTVTPADEEAARFSSSEPAPSPTANVTPFAPRRSESEAPRPSVRPAPERVGGARRADGPLDDPLRPSVPRGEEDGAGRRTGERREEPANRWTEEPRGHRGYDAPPARPQRPATRDAERFERASEHDGRPAYREAEQDGRPAYREAEAGVRAPERTGRPAYRDEHEDREGREETVRRDGYGERTAPRYEEPAGHGREEYPGHGRPDTGPRAPHTAPADGTARPASPVFEEEGEPYGGPAAAPVARPEPSRPEPRPEPLPAERPRAAPAAEERPDRRERPAWSAAADQVPPAAPLSQPAPRRRRATIDLNDTGTPRRAADPSPAAPSAPLPAAAAGGDRPAPKRKGRGRRASVPSWDEIMFGAKKDD